MPSLLLTPLEKLAEKWYSKQATAQAAFSRNCVREVGFTSLRLVGVLGRQGLWHFLLPWF